MATEMKAYLPDPFSLMSKIGKSDPPTLSRSAKIGTLRKVSKTKYGKKWGKKWM